MIEEAETQGRGFVARRLLMPVLVFGLLGGGFAITWWQGQRHQAGLLRAETRVAVEQSAARLEDTLRTRLEMVNQIRREWQIAPFPDRETFERRSLSLQEEFSEYQAVNWIDPDGVIRWVVPREPNLAAENRDLHQHPDAAVTFVRAEQTRTVQVTPPVHLLQGGLGLASYFPIVADGRLLGYLNGVFRIRPLVELSLHGAVLNSYSVVVRAGDNEVFSNGVERGHGEERLVATAPLDLPVPGWTISLAPTPARLRAARPSTAAYGLLLVGLLLAGALAFLTGLEMRREVELERSERRYRKLFEDSMDPIYVSTPAGRFLDANEAAVRLFRAGSKERLLEVDLARDIFVDPADRDDLLERLRQRGFVRGHQLRLKDLEGEEILARATATAVNDAAGRLVAIRGLIHDETERVRMQEKLNQMQRMESMSTLAGGIAHDFNNVLSGILGYASLLTMKLDDPKLVGYAKMIESSVNSAATITSQLLAFSQGALRRRGPVDLNRVVSETMAILERTIAPSIRIERRLADHLPPVLGDAGELQQVVLNLCLNGRDAMPDGGVLTVTTAAEETEGEEREVVLVVADTGVGMDDETRARVFEPFFTTKGQGRGPGLGLAVVFGVVRSHSGSIDVDSGPGRGSTFTVRLPAAEDELCEARVAETGEGGERETILVVDDNPTVRSLLGEILEAHGYRTLEARDGLEAVEVYEARGGEVDLVILDLLMPRMDGRATFERLRQLDPEVSVLLASGYSEEGEGRELIEAGASGFLAKPFQAGELLTAVRGVFARR